MRRLTRFLMFFMAVRMLAPPGICVCELTRPLERLIAAAYDTPQPPDHCEEEDPLFGCVVCQLPAAIESKQAPAPRLALSLDAAPYHEVGFRAAFPLSLVAYQPSLRPPGARLYLSQSPLLI